MTIPALLYVDRWGRRPTLLAGATLMMTWMFANAGLLATYGEYAGPEGVNHTPEASTRISGPPAKAVIACTYLFVASFAPTFGPVSWIYPPEIYPLRVRGKAVALSTSANWAMNFALAYFVPPAFVAITWKVYLVFAVFLVAMFVHVFFMFPETANKTLEEVESIFLDPHGIKWVGTPAWKTRVGNSGILDVERRGGGRGGGGGGGADDEERKGVAGGSVSVSEQRVERLSSPEGSLAHDRKV